MSSELIGPKLSASESTSLESDFQLVCVGTQNLWFDFESWPSRLPVLLTQFADADLGVLCVQENLIREGGSMLQDLVAGLGGGWQVVSEVGWAPRPGGMAGLGVAARLGASRLPEGCLVDPECESGVVAALLEVAGLIAVPAEGRSCSLVAGHEPVVEVDGLSDRVGVE